VVSVDAAELAVIPADDLVRVHADPGALGRRAADRLADVVARVVVGLSSAFVETRARISTT
jgi:hypothetical protein